MDKDMKKILRKLEKEQGWRIEDHGGHVKAFPPDRTKPFVTVESTPSDWRDRKNTIARLRKSGADI